MASKSNVEKKDEQKKPERKPRVFRGTVHVLVEICKGCGFCIEYCPKKILVASEDFNGKGYHYPVVKEENKCVNCKVCEDICPDFAIFSIPETEEESEKEDGGKS